MRVGEDRWWHSLIIAQSRSSTSTALLLVQELIPRNVFGLFKVASVGTAMVDQHSLNMCCNLIEWRTG